MQIFVDICGKELYNRTRNLNCGCGGTGRRVRLRGVWETVWVQVPLAAPENPDILKMSGLFFYFLFLIDLQNFQNNEFKV